MRLSRRAFLAGGSLSALALLAAPRLAAARGLLVDPGLDEIIKRVFSRATASGTTYADVRIVRHRTEHVATREDRVEHVGYGEEYGIGVRVIKDGAWGFAASPLVSLAEVDRIVDAAARIATANAAARKRAPVVLAPVPANVDVWQTPRTKDPFKIPLEDKAELLLAINREAMRVPGVKFVTSHYSGVAEWKLMASSDGAYVEQEIVRVGPGFNVTAVDAKLGVESRAHDLPPRQAGWEYVEAANLAGDARRIAEQAVEKLAAPSVVAGKRDLILDPTNLWLTIHESIGHPTELDRALGYEANFAGTSFATPDKRGKLRIGAPILTFYADKTTPGGLATCGYDDDGVATQRWNLVENGIFVGYQTTREQAGWIGEPASRGTAYADSYASVPFQRMPNVSLAPGAKEQSIDDLVAATDDGVLIVGNGSWSIDHQRLNFQFGGQAFWEIKHGKRTHMLRDVAYQANTIDFWSSCDQLGGPKSWWMGGTLNDGKGEPSQNNPVSHGCPPARFRKVNILDTNRRGG